MDKKELFTEKERVIGHVELDSGSLMITDGIWETSLGIAEKNRVVVDLNMDKVRLPIIATRQGNQRFLLIPIDLAEPVSVSLDQTVSVEDPVTLPPKEEDDE